MCRFIERARKGAKPILRMRRGAVRSIGPSGKPMIHRIKLPGRKAAEEAARHSGKGKPMHHPSPKVGKRHFHPTDGKGGKISDGTHYEY